MTKFFNAAAVLSLCALSTAASADGELHAEPGMQSQPSLAYINDMPYPETVPTFTPRVVFADMPFMEAELRGATNVTFGDLPFPTVIPAYKPTRYFSDMPIRPYTDAPSDHAMLVTD